MQKCRNRTRITHLAKGEEVNCGLKINNYHEEHEVHEENLIEKVLL